MYRQLANYYDEIYYFKNYQKETDKIKTLIQRHKKSSGNKLLDVACGTGNHIQYLKQHYSIGTPDEVQHVVDRESMGLWTHEEYLDAFRDGGLKVVFDPEGLMGRGLYVGVKS